VLDLDVLSRNDGATKKPAKQPEPAEKKGWEPNAEDA